MNKREKIIVILAVVAALIGGGYMAWEHLVLPSKVEQVETPPEVLEAQEVKSRIDAEAQAMGLTTHQSGQLSLIAMPWPRDPFLVPMLSEAEQTETAYDDYNLFVYSGYIEIGPIQAAIINGRERFLGDELDHPGYRVLRITPLQVEIGRPDGETTLNVVYQGMEFYP